MADTFKIYKKDGTKVVEGASPLSITGIAANTQVVKGDYQAARVSGETESAKVDIPAFKTLPIAVTDVALDKTAATVKQGDTFKLTPMVTPVNATDKSGAWKSSDTAVATVADGTVTVNAEAVVAATANITFTTKDGGKVATCKVTVSAKA